MTQYPPPSPTLSHPALAQARLAVGRSWRTVQGRLRTSWRPHAVWLGAPLNALQDPTVGVDAVTRFGQWCAAHPGQVCEVGLSASWLLTCVVPPAWSPQAGQQHALNQWAHYHDLDAPALSAHWVVRQVAAPQVFVLCAAPRTLIDGLQAQAAAHHVQLAWVGPWWARGVQACLSRWPEPEAEGDERVLRLREPGLTLCVHSRADAKRQWTLSHVQWSAADGVTEGTGSVHVPLPPGDAVDPAAPMLWDHPALQELLTGRSLVWRASA